LFQGSSIENSFQQVIKSVDFSQDDENQFLSVKEVLSAHYLIAEFFIELGEGIGGVGPKDINLLFSALSRQNACFDGICKYEGIFEIGAALLYALIKNHPFHDANKRTAFLSILYMLQKYNYTPNVTAKEFEDFLVEISDDSIKHKKRYKDMLRRGVDKPEVEYIAWYLRTKTRKIDKKQYLVTYRDLTKILRGFDFDLKYPSSGSISIIKYKKAILKNPFSSSAGRTVEQKIGTISYPGANKQVGKSVLRQVRLLTGLTEEKGYDSQVFYKDSDPLNILIAKYEQPLRRLANR
jgi:death-on-curing protein